MILNVEKYRDLAVTLHKTEWMNEWMNEWMHRWTKRISTVKYISKLINKVDDNLQLIESQRQVVSLLQYSCHQLAIRRVKVVRWTREWVTCEWVYQMTIGAYHNQHRAPTQAHAQAGCPPVPHCSLSVTQRYATVDKFKFLCHICALLISDCNGDKNVSWKTTVAISEGR